MKWSVMLDASFEGDYAWAADVVNRLLEIAKKELSMKNVKVSVFEEEGEG